MIRINDAKDYLGFIGIRIEFHSFRYNWHNFVINLGKSTYENIISIVSIIS